MAYNPYFPATYPYQQAYYQPQQMQAQPTSIIWVNNEREAQMYPVAPNNAVTLWNQTDPVVYLKQADATGKPSLKTFDLVERSATPSNASPAPDAKTPAYATKDDSSAALASLKGHDSALSAIRSEIDAIKQDVYGIAGKRSKKTEVKDDA